MTELELAQSQIVLLTTQSVLLRGEIITLKEKLAVEREQVRLLKSASGMFSEDVVGRTTLSFWGKPLTGHE